MIGVTDIVCRHAYIDRMWGADMSMRERFCGDVVILDMHGALASGAVDVGLWERIRDLSRHGCHKLLLNISNETSGNSFVVSTLLGALLAAHSERSELKLLNARRINDVQILVALCDYFETFDSEQDALASYTIATARNRGTGLRSNGVAA